jgi:hypothetical protein
MAVASMKGSFGLLTLKNVQEIKTSIDHWDPRDPSSILPITEVRCCVAVEWTEELT